jgi:hypothetical protein
VSLQENSYIIESSESLRNLHNSMEFAPDSPFRMQLFMRTIREIQDTMYLKYPEFSMW